MLTEAGSDEILVWNFFCTKMWLRLNHSHRDQPKCNGGPHGCFLLEYQRSEQAGSRRQGEVAVDDGAKTKDGGLHIKPLCPGLTASSSSH